MTIKTLLINGGCSESNAPCNTHHASRITHHASRPTDCRNKRRWENGLRFEFC